MQSNKNLPTRTTNLCFPEMVSDYLEQNGFQRVEGSTQFPSTIYFNKFPECIAVRNETVEFMIYNDEEPCQRKGSYSRTACFTGIAELEFFDWVLLLHITDTVRLKHFISAARREDKNIVPDLMKSLFEHFTPKELPVCY